MSNAATINPPFPPGSSEHDPARRRFLLRTTSVVGAVGIAAAAWPFIDSMEPSARALAQAGPVDIDISKLEPAQMLTVLWRRKPVWVLRRTKAQIAELPKLDGMLKDPKSQQAQQPPNLAHFDPQLRAINPEYLVLVGICTHLGCVPDYRKRTDRAGLGSSWPGGFFCPCHGSRYDLSGRVMQGSPAPLNLPVPPYYFSKPHVIHVGNLKGGKDDHWSPEVW